MNRKIILSLCLISAIAALAIGGTIAYFSDTETSVGNKFVAGKLNLKIDNTCHYNGKECVMIEPGYYVWQGTQEQCFCSWELKDLAGELFFNLLDVKPGDNGEDTVSLHIDNNDAWVCAQVTNLISDDNGCDSPENKIDTTCGAGEGELKENIFFTIWEDTDCDNILDEGTPGYCSGEDPCPIVSESDCRYDPEISQLCQWIDAIPAEQILVDNQPAQEGVWPIADSNTGAGPLEGGQTYCLGVKWNVPIETSNIIQSDSLIGDVIFTAVQARHMESFKCSDLVGGGECSAPEDCTGYYIGPVCDYPATCQGHRQDATCINGDCGSILVDDDSGCSVSTLADDCGPYPAIFCNGALSQEAPQCANSCSSEEECDPSADCVGGICQLSCVPTTEICGDGLDNDCDGETDEGCF